ncbi:MAG: hypothetical protein R2796_00435 [Chitinophagaceae bacterium]|nr:hypothetical protein [Chitinophagaceae bacterium]MCB0740672.1 hypothetical protein [Chitinophagaceae bacterium]HQV06054.1 hypothetical protein [Chitinophagaceae bacterium]
MNYKQLLAFFSFFFCINHYKAQAQVLTQEDSLYAGLISKDQKTVLSGYGEARYTVNTKRKTATASLSRVVLFVGHRFNHKISLFTEMELEDALVAGQSGDEDASAKGGISMEQAFLKFNLNPTTYLVAGLFIPRLGIINENHLPTTFNGVDRPFVEELIIPSTWREIGVGLYGTIKNIPGLNYSLALTNGLNAENFTSGSGIRKGRQLGSQAGGLGIGASGSLLYYIHNFRLQASGYIGGSTALERRVADSLLLDSGPFGNPVLLGEIDGQYTNKGWNVRLLAAGISIPKAFEINRAYANNTPNAIAGGYAETSYDVLYPKHKGAKSLLVFGRYEYMDLNASVPVNGIQNDANRQQYIIAGFTFKPIRGVAVKADYVQRITGEPNPALIITPFPQQVPYFKSNGFINLGVSYNF